MGNVYYEKEDYVNAEKFYNEAIYNFQLFDSNYDSEKYYGINTSLLNLSLIKRDQGDLKSSEDLLINFLKGLTAMQLAEQIFFKYIFHIWNYFLYLVMMSCL